MQSSDRHAVVLWLWKSPFRYDDRPQYVLLIKIPKASLDSICNNFIKPYMRKSAELCDRSDSDWLGSFCGIDPDLGLDRYRANGKRFAGAITCNIM